MNTMRKNEEKQNEKADSLSLLETVKNPYNLGDYYCFPLGRDVLLDISS